MTPAFKIENFSFSYPLSQYKIGFSGSITINQHDCILLQGNSGSGKSTLLLALKGVIPHLINGTLHGKIEYLGNDIASLKEQDLLNIGYLQQNPDNQLICRTVFAELAFGLENLGFNALQIHEKIITIAKEFNIDKLLDREVANLSGGEKQKINLLAILLMNPDVLLLDEPTAFLDPDSATEIITILNKYAHKKTLIIIEHNTHYLQNLVNRVINISHDGMINELNPTTIDWAPQLPCLIQDAPINNKTLLTIQNLSFGYNKQLFDKVNLSIQAGEIITIHGKNGAGKSTLLKLISKILPISNAIHLNNRDIAGIKDYWNEIFLLWQNPESHFIFNTVLEEVSGNEQLLSEFKLNAHAKQSPFNLSEGQKRRLSLAIALTKAPKVFLLDEPSFGQDQQNKLILVHKIHQLAKNGHAFIIITHDLTFSSAIAHKTYTLIDGRLELIHEPATMVRK